MGMEIKSHYYNYYHVKGRYTPSEPQETGWAKRYESVEDRIESNNSNKDTDLYKAYIKLEDIYYSVGVANRANYSSYEALQKAMSQKYLAWDSPYYKQYSQAERWAMYDKAIKASSKVPSEFKGAAYEHFASYVKQITSIDINTIEDLYLSIDFENGQLKDVSNSHLIRTGFNLMS